MIPLIKNDGWGYEYSTVPETPIMNVGDVVTINTTYTGNWIKDSARFEITGREFILTDNQNLEKTLTLKHYYVRPVE